MSTPDEVFSLFTNTIDLKYAARDGEIIWLNEKYQKSDTPRTDLNWFVNALENDENWDGNYQLYAFAKQGMGGDILANMTFGMSFTIVKTKQETAAEVVENFKAYLFDIYTKNR
jgi:hypothetical protein